MNGFIPRFAFWNPSTWAIPTLYWDTFSQEQRIHAICRQLGKVINYADMLGVNVDDIAARLKAIEEGQLDDFIIAAIEEWFNENQPAIMEALNNLQEALPIEDYNADHTVTDEFNDVKDRVTDEFNDVKGRITVNENNISTIIDTIGTGLFSPENTITDVFNDFKDDTEEAIQATNENVSYLQSYMNEVDVNNFVYPKKIGIIRVRTYVHTQTTENRVRWAQGFSVHDGEMVQAIADSDITNPVARFYTRNIAETSWSSPISANTYKSSSIKYVDRENAYFVGTGRDGEIAKLDAGLNRIGLFTVDSRTSVVLLAYDKVTGILYGSHYGKDLFILHNYDNTNVEYLPLWENRINTDNGFLQDIAAYNGFLYILYSSTGRIEKWRISDGQYICSYTMLNDQLNYVIGETEGIDVDEDGSIYFSASTRINDMRDFDYTYIMRFDPDNPDANINAWRTSFSGTTRVVIDPSDANLLACQQADGSSANPYPTIGEAFFDFFNNPYLTTMSISGNHSEEMVSVYIPHLIIEGTEGAQIGAVTTRAAWLVINNIKINPLVQVTNYITGFRNGVVQIANLTYGTALPPTGHTISVQGQLIEGITTTTRDY